LLIVTLMRLEPIGSDKKVSFRQQCMIFGNNHALLPKVYGDPTSGNATSVGSWKKEDWAFCNRSVTLLLGSGFI